MTVKLILFLIAHGLWSPCYYVEDPRCHGVGDCGVYRGDRCENMRLTILDGQNCSGWCEE